MLSKSGLLKTLDVFRQAGYNTSSGTPGPDQITCPRPLSGLAASGEDPSMELTLRVAGIEEESIVDGPGMRLTLFTQGCRHNCPGCHNPQTHPLDGGSLMEAGEVLRLFREDPLLAGITFSGGEPFLQPGPLVWLAKEVHAMGRNVCAFSGYTYEQLLELGLSNPDVAALLDELDFLIDGPYVEALRDLELDYRGSSNQRFLKRADLDGLKAAWLESRA